MLRRDRTAYSDDGDDLDDDDDDLDDYNLYGGGWEEEGGKQEVRVYNVGDNDLWRVHWGELAVYVEWNDDDRFN